MKGQALASKPYLELNCIRTQPHLVNFVPIASESFFTAKKQISPHLIDRHVTCQPGNINPIAGFPGPLLLRPKQHGHGALALFAVGAMPFQCN